MTDLVTFDVDHTLTLGLEAQKLAFFEGLRLVHGIDIPHEHILRYPGWTDMAIIKDLAAKYGVEKPDVKACIKAMSDVFPALNKQHHLVTLPGVAALLKALKERGAIIGLVTGNLEVIAQNKMEKLGLKDYFSVGGYGSDHEERAELIRLAMQRAKEYGFDGKATHVGDTPQDIAAAKTAGAKSLAVATGHLSAEELQKAGADHVLPDLSDTEQALRILLD